MTETIVKYDAIFTETGWQEPGYIVLDKADHVIEIRHDITNAHREESGWLIPSIVNSHSHCFQFAMAGCAEIPTPEGKSDDFWAWRQQMYHLANHVTPDHIYDIARLLYRQMITRGYGHVVEFQYIHNDVDGRPYQRPGIISSTIAEAAESVGMSLTLIPVFYNQASFQKDILPDQKRFFIKDLEQYYLLIEDISAHTKYMNHCQVGYGLHSLRAAKEQQIRQLINQRDVTRPFHLHISEQTQEVDDCLDAWKARPVQWLLENCDTGHGMNLVHATHLDKSELAQLNQWQGNIVLCPTTEANLGDGFFPIEDYDGSWSIGSDSHIIVDPFEELRMLDYGARLRLQKRNILSQHGVPTADFLFTQSVKGGFQSIGRDGSFYTKDRPLNGLVIDNNSWVFAGISPENRLGKITFSDPQNIIKHFWVNGRKNLPWGRQDKDDEIVSNCQKTLKTLKDFPG